MRSARLAATLAGLALAAVLAPAVAQATTLHLAGGAPRPQPYQTWVDRSAVPTPPGVVTVNLAACPGAPSWSAACVNPATRIIHLGAEGRDSVTLLHELGHVFDAYVLDDAGRAQFQAIARAPGAWDGAAGSNPPIEQFAEAYALCARHPVLRRPRVGMYAYQVTPRRHAQVCAVIRAAAVRAGL
jgi:hypothetical protein